MQQYLATHLEFIGQAAVVGALCLAVISLCGYVYLQKKSRIYAEGIFIRVNGKVIDPESLPALREELEGIEEGTSQINANYPYT